MRAAVNRPRFAGVEQGREDHGTVSLDLGLKAEPSLCAPRQSCGVCQQLHFRWLPLINVGRTRQGAT